MNRRVAGLLAALALGAAAVAGAGWWGSRPRRPPDLLFVVMDTVRADRTHVCGYGLPTTPVLDRLGAEGWQVACDAVSPASWTLPSHLAFFTGRPYVDLLEDPTGATLAEALRSAGYDTALLSANTVLRKDERFRRGFRQHRVARTMVELKGRALEPALDEILAGADPDRPLFLFVNLVDAHAPYLRIPGDLGWLPPQPQLNVRRYAKDPDSPWSRFSRSAMGTDEREAFLAALDHGYDYGVFLTDQNVGVVLEAWRRSGRDRDARQVVTSDHGELLGEHGAIGHGDTLWEPGLRVPFLYRDTRRPDARLPAPLGALQAFHLLRGGAPAEVPLATTNHRFRFPEAWIGAAVWTAEGQKLVSVGGERRRYDLATDPGEGAPLPVLPGPDADTLDALASRAARHAAPLDEDTVELLRAAGYVGDDP